MIYPHLDCVMKVLGTTYNKRPNKLVIVQENDLRIISGPRDTMTTLPHYLSNTNYLN